VKEQRCRVCQRIYTVQYAAVARNDCGSIFDVQIPFQCGNVHIADKSGQTDIDPCDDTAGQSERGDQGSEQYSEHCRCQYAAEKACPCLIRRDLRQNFPFAELFTQKKLCDILRLCEHNEE